MLGARRHEWKAAHGFRKFFKTMTEQAMKPIHVEILMGHNIGLSASYYKPTEKDILEDYHNAVKLLTINETNRLQEKIVSIEGKQDEFTFMKLERQKEMKALREELEPLLALKKILLKEGVLKEN